MQDQDCGGVTQGRCVKNNCVCEGGYTGYHCTFRKDEICGNIQIDGLTGTSFASQRPLSSSYQLANGIEAYRRAVYFNDLTGDLMLYAGLRWILTNAADPGFARFGGNLAAVLDYVGSADFHGSEVQRVDMMSEQVWVRSANDDSMSPIGLQ